MNVELEEAGRRPVGARRAGRAATGRRGPTTRREPSIRARLVGVVLAVVLPALLLGAGAMFWLWRQGKAEAEQELLARSHSLASVVRRELGQSEALLRALATSPLLATDDLAGFHRQLRTLDLQSDARIVLADASGQMRLHSRVAFGTPLPARGDPALVGQVFASGRWQVSNVYTSLLTKQAVVAVDVPVVLDGAVRHVLSMAASVDTFGELLRQQRPPGEGWLLAILDARAVFVAREPDHATFAGRTGSVAVQAFVDGSQREAIVRSPGVSGIPTLVAYVRVPDTPWTVAVGRYESVFEAALVESLSQLVLLMLGVLAIGLVVALRQALRIQRAIASIERTAEEVGAGRVPSRQAGPGMGVRETSAVRDALVTAAERLAQRAAERDAAERQLREADARKDEFLAMLAHELRNPLAPIVNGVRLIGRRETLSEPGRRALDMIERQSGQMKRLIDDLLEINRISRGKITLRPEAMLLDVTVRQVAEAMQPVIEQRGQALELALPARSLPIVADPARIAQVLENLLGNASKYTPDGGRIHVEVEGGDHAACVRVTDDGIGLDPADLERVFGLFEQAQASVGPYQGGLGIGLAMVRRIVEMHGGRAWAESAGRGQGARFVVRLPLEPVGQG